MIFVALLGIGHFRIARAAIAFSLTERCNQRAVICRAALKQEPLGPQKITHRRKDGFGQTKLLEKLPEPRDRRFVGQLALASIQVATPTINLGFVQRLFHRRIVMVIPKLDEVDPLPHLIRKPYAAGLGNQGEALNYRNKRCPGDHLAHRFLKILLARFSGESSIPLSAKTGVLSPNFCYYTVSNDLLSHCFP